MKSIICYILLFITGLNTLSAQTLDLSPEELSPLRKVFEGKYHFIDEETGDTLCMYVFYPITVYPKEKFKNKKQ